MASTAVGIEISKYNATKHGLTGKQIVIKGEEPAQYDALRAALNAEYDPQSEEESMLVERIAQNWWKLQRAERVDPQMQSKPDYHLDPNFYRFQRYKRTIERAWEAARKELTAMQRERWEAEQQQLERQRAARELEHIRKHTNPMIVNPFASRRHPAPPVAEFVLANQNAPSNTEPSSAAAVR